MQVSTIEEITPALSTDDCYRDFCFSSAVLETEGYGSHEEYNIDITASVFDATPDLHLWATSKGGDRNVVKVKLFTTEYEVEERPGRNTTFYREIDTEIASNTIGPDELSFEAVCRVLQRLADRAYGLDTIEMPSHTCETDE